ncbi:putative uncharacterized protein DDB_G0282499 isoform X2 [Drosophila innubila]|uniref:putative uncharacterized protein DDB_G0282499 isoform X2 n=1 Tax=Drosophila innubila TaxID=198719 RepID=UPI00148E0C7F|nr:putative uncharacterized protein DDB_G0282499 isoform X2 [Drosophila innubila]
MRINQRLDWRALALLGALLSFIIAWPGLVFAMPALTTMSNQSINNMQANINISNTTHSYNNYNNNNLSNLIDSNSSIQSDHSRSSPLVLNKKESENSLNQNQSISAEFNMRTLTTTTNQSTAIITINNTITTATTPNPDSSSISSTTPAIITDKDDEYQEQESDALGFSISVARREHLAILSRTERSIRHQQQHLHHQQLHHRQQQQQQQQSPANANGNSNSNSNFIGSKSKRLNNFRNNLNINSSNNHPNIINNNNNNNNLDRNERSTISHLAGPSRKIQLYIKNRFLQLLPDGTVNGTQTEQSEYAILQRSTVDVGRIKIQSVATCLYLCMDACGAVYASTSTTTVSSTRTWSCITTTPTPPHTTRMRGGSCIWHLIAMEHRVARKFRQPDHWAICRNTRMRSLRRCRNSVWSS